jgi:non-ribosomal peptide synthetase component F
VDSFTTPKPAARWLHQVFETTCDAVPSTVALECEQMRVTYAELDAQANKLAHHLRSLGIGGGRRVAILLQRSVETYVTLLGVGKAGAAFVPIDPASPPDRIDYITEDSSVDLLVTTAELNSGAGGRGCPVLEIDKCTDALAAAPRTRPELGLGGWCRTAASGIVAACRDRHGGLAGHQRPTVVGRSGGGLLWG